MAARILEKAAKYKLAPQIDYALQAHERDPLIPPPKILRPPPPRTKKDPNDISDFPMQKDVPMPENIPYREGAYPYNQYLQAGKVYLWCACGISTTGPFCDNLCNTLPTRCRPVQFNVSESGYYKMCNCKQSANAPFCNDTHRKAIRAHHLSHRGFFEIWAQILYMLTWMYMYWNYYT